MPGPTDAVDASRADIGLVCALSLETGDFLKRCERVRTYRGGKFTFRGGIYDGIRLVIVESGAGADPARRATQALLDAHRPQWVISCGFAGALDPSLSLGNIVVADRLVCADQTDVRIDTGMTSNPARGRHVGAILMTPQIVRKAAEKKQLGEQHQALAVDLESYAVAALCRDLKQRCFVVRVISDDAATDLPPEVLTVIGATGAVRMGAVLGALWKRPGSAQDLWRLREHATQAAEQLANFLDGVVRQLHAATASLGTP